MFKVFQLTLVRNWRSILLLFVVLVLASTGFLVLRQLTANIEKQVVVQTQPLFGADIRISSRSSNSGSLFSIFSPYLTGTAYSWAERISFSTTLFDREGKTGLIQVIAYTGTYPQRGILKLQSIIGVSLSGQMIAVTPEILGRYASGGILSVDDRPIRPTHTILESSDLGFSFGSENSLMILPQSALSGSMLISSGSRLSQELLLSLTDIGEVDILVKKLRENSTLSGFTIRSYNERSERNFATTKELTNYILLILVVAALFAGIILRSAHGHLFSTLSQTLRIIEILGFSRKRQMYIFGALYTVLVPVAFGVSLGLAYGTIHLLSRIPEAREFVFLSEPIFFSMKMMLILVVSAFSPTWVRRLYGDTSYFIEKLRSRFSRFFVFVPELSEIVPVLLGGFFILFIIFDDLLWSLKFICIAGVGLAAGGWCILEGYRLLLRRVTYLRRNHFFFYDGIRTLVRPMTPTVSLSLSLILIAAFFVLFGLFSLSFRAKLQIDAEHTANIYAINILPADSERITQSMTGIEIYSILQARVTEINHRSLALHLGTPEPSREFTREFNITTTPLANPILEGKKEIGRDEVSVDDEFAKRLGVKPGDRITFLLSGREVTLTVSGIRESIRDGFRPFFYFSFSETAFKNAPKTYFAATYSPDIEAWKQQILSLSGPHVTFIDVENILKIVREISSKILSVIALFFVAISVFGIFSVYSLFAELRPVEDMKRRLYPLFGASGKNTKKSMHTARIGILGSSFVLSQIIGIGIYTIVIRSSSFLTLSLPHIGIMLLVTCIGYIGLYVLIRPRDSVP